MGKKQIITIFLCFFSLVSCYHKEGLDIGDYPKETLSYIELPNQVQKILQTKVSKATPSYEGLVYTTDENVLFEHYRKNIEKKSWLYKVNNNDDYFIVNDTIYRKTGNNGTPYIYHKGFLYFGDLNIYDDYRERTYYKVLLKDK